MNKINEMVTEMVKDYMGNGYTLYLGENAHGSQSREDFAIHLTNDNGKTVLKIYGTVKRGENWTRELHVIAEEFENDGSRTFWDGTGKNISDKVFYVYESRKGKELYIENKEEFDRLNQIKEQRRENRKNKTTELKSDKAKKIALKLLKKKKGYKSTKLCEIKRLERQGGRYAVYLENRGRVAI